MMCSMDDVGLVSRKQKHHIKGTGEREKKDQDYTYILVCVYICICLYVSFFCLHGYS